MEVNNLKKLTNIGLKHGTDKAFYHSFTEFYSEYFDKFLDKPINILEIGIASGSSLLMLKEYFPKATIYAIDINENSVNLKLGENINTYLCSQIDFVKLNEIIKDIKFDIIIDDGSHITSHQEKSLGFLFPFLNKNGIYVCEDLHTSLKRTFVDTKITILDILKNFNITKKIEATLIDSKNLEYLNENISKIEIYYRNTNALQCYSCKKYNSNNLPFCSCGTNISPTDLSITSIIRHK